MHEIIELKEIEKTMLRSKELFHNGVPTAVNLELERLVNCYAYSLGIMYPKSIFNPGFSQNLKYYGREPEELMVKVYIDLETMGKQFRRINLNDEVILGENEYLIEVFYSPPNEKSKEVGDFHFIRQDKQSGFWFQKWKNQQPTILPTDPLFKFGVTVIDNIWEDGFVFRYEAVGYFAVSEV